MAERTLGRTLWSLFLALFNATLILVALCLFLGWSLFSTIEGVTGNVAEVTSTLRPIRAEIRDLTGEIGTARTAIADLRAGGGADLHVCDRLEAQVARAEARIAELNATLVRIEGDLYPAVEQAVTNAFGRIGTALVEAIATPLGLAPQGEQGSE